MQLYHKSSHTEQRYPILNLKSLFFSAEVTKSRGKNFFFSYSSIYLLSNLAQLPGKIGIYLIKKIQPGQSLYMQINVFS